MKVQVVGWLLAILGVLGLLVFVFVFSFYKFRHETLTETQLTIWCLQRWYEWLPAGIVTALGLTIVSSKR